MNLVDKIFFDPISKGLKFFSRSGKLTDLTKGVVDGSSAAAGHVGESIRSAANPGGVAIGAADTFINLTSIVLSPGDWDISGIVVVNSNTAATTIMDLAISINSGNTLTDHVQGDNQVRTWVQDAVSGFGTNFATLTIPNFRKNLTSTTTIYLKTAGKDLNNRYHSYRISARRVR